MKFCKECMVQVDAPGACCPLCGAPLLSDSGDEAPPAYPQVASRKRYHFAYRLLFFLSLLTVAVCGLVNWLVTPGSFWWPFVVTVVVYAWLAVPHALRRGGNGGGKTLMQVVCASALVVLLDVEIGWQGWSVSFVLPFIFCAGIVAVFVLILCNRTNWAGYVVYQVVLAIFGFVPLVLYLAGAAKSLVAVLVPTVLPAASLAALAAFGDRSIKSEFKRRLHF